MFCINYLLCLCDQVHNRNNWREWEFTWAHGFRGVPDCHSEGGMVAKVMTLWRWKCGPACSCAFAGRQTAQVRTRSEQHLQRLSPCELFLPGRPHFSGFLSLLNKHQKLGTGHLEYPVGTAQTWSLFYFHFYVFISFYVFVSCLGMYYTFTCVWVHMWTVCVFCICV